MTILIGLTRPAKVEGVREAVAAIAAFAPFYNARACVVTFTTRSS